MEIHIQVEAEVGVEKKAVEKKKLLLYSERAKG